MKRRLVVLSLVSLLLLFSQVAYGKVTVTHFTNMHHGTVYHEWIQEQARIFNASQDEVEVEIILGLAANLKVMMASGMSPHISDIHLYENPIGLRVDLRPLMERDGITRLIHPAILEQAEAADGGIYQAPLEVAAQPTYFNRDLFDQAGIPAPDQLKDKWNWEAVISSGKKITVDRNGDGVPEVFGVDRPWGGWRTAVSQAGGAFYEFDSKGNPMRSLWNTPEVEAGLEFIARIYRERITPAGVVPNERNFDVYSGLSAMTLTDGMSGMGTLQGASFTYDVWLQPSGPAGPYATVGVSGPQILHDKDLEASWAWLKHYVFSLESQEAFAKATGRLPSTRQAQASYPVLLNVQHINFQAILDQSVLGSPYKNYGLPDELHPRRVNVTAIWNGTQPIRSFLNNMHNVMTARLQEFLSRQ